MTSGSHPFGESPSEQTYGIINDTPNIPEHLLNSPCGRHLPNMLQHKPTYRPTASQILEILEQMDDREFQTSTKKSITKPMLQEKLVLNSFLTKKPSMKIPRVVFNPFLDKTVGFLKIIGSTKFIISCSESAHSYLFYGHHN